MPTLKENYETIDAILQQNDEIFIQIDEVIADIEKKIREYNEICIPILKAMRKPEIICCTAKTEDGKEYPQYKIEKTKRIVLQSELKLDKKKIQALLNEFSPTKLIVDEICWDHSVMISVG